MCTFTQNLNGGKKSYEFLKFAKNGRIFGHIFQILIFFKICFVTLNGQKDDTKL